jgi:anti-sigma regulatory factor (Ser/Thr protein kinase)
MKVLLKIKITFILFFVFSGIIFSQGNYSSKTINELNILNENIEIAISKNDSLSVARAYYKLALKYDYLDQNDSCDLYYNKALFIATKINNGKAAAIISNALATTYSDRGFHNDAIKIYNEIIERFLFLEDSSAAAGAMLNIAAEYFDVGKHQKGLEYSINSLKLKIGSGDSTNIAAFYQQIGSMFNALGDKDKWIEYTQLANLLVKSNEKYGDFYRRMDILNELGGYYLSEGEYEVAKNYYDTLYTESKNHDYLVGITVATSNLVPILKNQSEFLEALNYSKKALKLAEKAAKTNRIIHNLIETAKLELLLSQNSGAEMHLFRAKELAVKYNFPSMQIAIYKLLSKINSEKGNYKLSLKYLNAHLTLKDSIESSETKRKIAELETKYQTEVKDNQIEILNKENVIQQEKILIRNRTVIGLILLGVLVITLFILFYTQTKLKTQNRFLNLHQKLLRTQMNPHFIFNALIAIQNYILKNKKFEASDYLAQFATLMRLILEGSREDFHSLEKEIKLLNNYISLQQLRFENSFIFELEVDERINIETLEIPPMIIQPFIENAIEHGLRKIVDEEKILSVKYILDENSLLIIIEDNGIGIEQRKGDILGKKHKSFAMEITNERLSNITKIYKEKIDILVQDLSINENRRGTKIKFKFPLKFLKRNKND